MAANPVPLFAMDVLTDISSTLIRSRSSAMSGKRQRGTAKAVKERQRDTAKAVDERQRDTAEAVEEVRSVWDEKNRVFSD